MITAVHHTQHHVPQTKGEFVNAAHHTDHRQQTPSHTIYSQLSSAFVRVRPRPIF